MKVLELPPSEYEHIKIVESGKMLTDIFPNGFSVTFNDQMEIESIYNGIFGNKRLDEPQSNQVNSQP